jgi:hypothetical protein
MVIKDQNALNCFALSICGRQEAHSLDDENPFRTAAGLFAPGRKTQDERSVTCSGPNGPRRERYRVKARDVPFHDFTL